MILIFHNFSNFPADPIYAFNIKVPAFCNVKIVWLNKTIKLTNHNHPFVKPLVVSHKKYVEKNKLIISRASYLLCFCLKFSFYLNSNRIRLLWVQWSI